MVLCYYVYSKFTQNFADISSYSMTILTFSLILKGFISGQKRSDNQRFVLLPGSNAAQGIRFYELRIWRTVSLTGDGTFRR